MNTLLPSDVGWLRQVRETGRIVHLPMPIFLKLVGLGLLVISTGRTWRLTSSGNEALDGDDKG